MILYKRKSRSIQSLWVRIRNEPYLFINIFFAGVILLIIAYSGIFSPEENNYPVACLHEKLTGEPCFSCGLSHSFSLIVRGRIDEAYQWNPYGMRVFLFFALQLVLRVAFSIFYLRNPNTRKQLIIIDYIGSGLIFLIAFWPFIANIVSGVLHQV
ncbi:MAG TPA: DUF2752 domain-containing protein [Bacteroidales bacterium]|nr:DUF2752 domain-containing protein [Bacteroidales bacterium]